MNSIKLTILFTVLISINAMAADTLNAKQENIVTISAFTAIGDMTRLNATLHAGLDAGLTVSEIKEVIVQLYAYAGFPRSLNALNSFMEVLKERKTKGINDVTGKTASPYPLNKTKMEFGTENQTKLVGTHVKGEVYEFAPAIDQFLKEHLFGDIFGRDILDYKTREIATISALASLSGTANQLRSHFNVGMHNGLTAQQLKEIVSIIKIKVGDTEGNNAAIVLQAIVKHVREVNVNFTGNVYVNMIVAPDSVFNTQMANVTFEPGARTHWHYHPSGQILMITDGIAYYQEKGKPKQTLLKGEIAKCPPGVAHWHGATTGGSMTHLVVSSNLDKGTVVWLERVTEEEYNSNAKN
ncbi:MAG: carboxymuconolactone decarboxylase family protein [Bacteroidota bacterium]